MAVFAWNENYSVNIKEIDEQHKKLIGFIAKLDDAMRKGQGKSALEGILKELVQYTRTHFAAEERIMKTHGYPEFEEHKRKHDSMTQKVLDVQKQYEDGAINITLEVMKFLENWVDKHIMGTDKEYSSFLNAKGVC